MFAALLVALALLPLLSAVVVLSQGWRPTGDNALIGLRAHDVLTGRLPLVGQPSTGENFGTGIATSHPGPIEFYLLAPFVLLLGPAAGLALGAAAIHSAGLVGIGWLSFRRGGLGLMLGASLASVLMCRSFGGNLLHDPVSSNVGAVVALTLLFAAWSVVAGDLRALPVLVVSGSFALQDHLSYLGTGAPVILAALVVGGWWVREVVRRASDASWLRPRLLVSGAIGLVLWAPVLIDQFFGDHNLSAIVRTFTTKGSGGEAAGSGGAGLTFGLKRLAEALAPWPIFSRRVPRLGYLHTPAPHELVGGYLVLLAVVVLALHFWRMRRADLAALGLTVVVAALAGVYTAVKLPGGAGVKEANLRWMWTVSAFTWIALGILVWAVLPALWREVVGAPASILAGAAAVVAAWSLVGSVGLATDRDGPLARDTDALSARVQDELPHGTYRVTYDGTAVVLTIGPALVHDLDHRGDRLFVDIGSFGRAYGANREYDDQEVDGTILVTTEASGSYDPRIRLLARRSFAVPRDDAWSHTVRVYLVKEQA
jgi:hypothetical protein